MFRYTVERVVKSFAGVMLAGLVASCSLLMPSHTALVYDPLECEAPANNVRTVTYGISPDFPAEEAKWIRKAMDVWEVGTRRVKFVKSNKDPEIQFSREHIYVETMRDGSKEYCHTLAEYHFGTHMIVVYADCIAGWEVNRVEINYVATMVHELGHHLIVSHYTGPEASYLHPGVDKAPKDGVLPLRDRLEFCRYQDCRCR